MNIKLIFYCVILLVGFGCDLSTDGDTDQNESIDIGSYALLSSTIDNFVYGNVEKLRFVDSLGNHRILFIKEESIRTKTSEIIVEDPATFSKKYYRFTNEVKRYTCSNDSFGITFFMELEARPYAKEPEQRFVADILNIYTPDLNQKPSLVMYYEVDRRTWPSSFLGMPSDLTIHGKTFREVYETNVLNPFTTVWYNNEKGLIAYKDFGSKTWRLD